MHQARSVGCGRGSVRRPFLVAGLLRPTIRRRGSRRGLKFPGRYRDPSLQSAVHIHLAHRLFVMATVIANSGNRRRSGAFAQPGFTIVELMIVLVVVAVLVGIGAPAFTNMLLDNRSLSALNDLRGALSTARSEALAQRAFVTFCSSADGAVCGGTWDLGYLGFVDFDGDAAIDVGGGGADDQVVVSRTNAARFLTITLNSANGLGRMRFDPDGTALGNGGTLTICDERGATEARALFVSNSGQSRSLLDTDGNDIPNLPASEGGADVACP